MTVSTSPLEIDGRVVQPPDVKFGNNAKVSLTLTAMLCFRS